MKDVCSGSIRALVVVLFAAGLAGARQAVAPPKPDAVELAVKEGGAPGLMFFLAVYAVMDLGAFGILGTLSGEAADLDALEDYQGLGYSRPWRAGVLAVCLLSLAGLPPTAGFMGKLVLFKVVLQAHYWVLPVIGILTVIISIYFYMKVVVSLYMWPRGEGPAIPRAEATGALAGAVILILLLWLGLLPGSVLALVGRLDADTSGIEGGTFTWHAGEIRGKRRRHACLREPLEPEAGVEFARCEDRIAARVHHPDSAGERHREGTSLRKLERLLRRDVLDAYGEACGPRAPARAAHGLRAGRNGAQQRCCSTNAMQGPTVHRDLPLMGSPRKRPSSSARRTTLRHAHPNPAEAACGALTSGAQS